MAGGKVDQSFEMTFDPKLARMRVAFEDWSGLIGDWRPAWKHLRTLFRKHEARHLSTEGSSSGDGSLFPKLSTRYGAWKAKNYDSGLPILQREKVLFRALVEGVPSSAVFNRMTKTSLTLGIKPNAVVEDPKRSGRSYHLGVAAQAHASGATLKMPQGTTATLPQRPPIRFNGNVQDRSSFGYAASQILQAHIVKARRKALSKDIEAAIGGPSGAHKGPDATIESILTREWR